MNGIMSLFSNFQHNFYLNFIKEARYTMVLNGLGNTLLISLFAIILGIALGSITFFMRRSRFKVIRAIGYLYVDVIRGTPMVTQLFIIYFVIFASAHIDTTLIAVLGFGFNSGAYVSEIIRAGVQSIDRGQTEAGRSLGLTSAQTMTYIVAPQAVKNILPTLCNEFVVLIKETAVVGYLAVQDLTRSADIIRSRTYDPYMPLLSAALIYYIIVKVLTIFITKLEKSMHKGDHVLTDIR